jgi:hypothetical protein
MKFVDSRVIKTHSLGLLARYQIVAIVAKTPVFDSGFRGENPDCHEIVRWQTPSNVHFKPDPGQCVLLLLSIGGNPILSLAIVFRKAVNSNRGACDEKNS